MEHLHLRDLFIPPSSSDLVCDAMRATLDMEIALYISQFPAAKNEPMLHKAASYKNCFTGSMLSLLYLHGYHPDSFDQYFLVRSYDTKDRWNFHTYFAVRDKEGLFHGGSSANSPGDNRNFPFLPPLTEGNIHALMDTITKESPGKWPNSGIIESFLRQSFFTPRPILSNPNSRGITEFRYQDGKTTKNDIVMDVPPICMPSLSDPLMFRTTFDD